MGAGNCLNLKSFRDTSSPTKAINERKDFNVEEGQERGFWYEKDERCLRDLGLSKGIR